MNSRGNQRRSRLRFALQQLVVACLFASTGYGAASLIHGARMEKLRGLQTDLARSNDPLRDY